MKLYYDAEKTKEVNEKLWHKYGDMKKQWAEKGYNVSEVSGCEVRCYCNRTGVEQRHTQGDVGFLVFGIVSEQVVMSIYPEETRQYEANLNELVWGHLDAFEELKYPVEGKATAKRIFKAADIPTVWRTQLLNYVVMVGASKGWFFILDIFTRHFSVFCMEITKDDQLLQIQVVMDKVSKFDKSIASKDPSILSIMPEEYALCGYKHSCPRRVECKEKYGKMKKNAEH